MGVPVRRVSRSDSSMEGFVLPHTRGNEADRSRISIPIQHGQVRVRTRQILAALSAQLPKAGVEA